LFDGAGRFIRQRSSADQHRTSIVTVASGWHTRTMTKPQDKRKAVRRSLALPQMQRFGKALSPKPRDNPPKYVWLRLKPEPRLTPYRDD